jgi:hypothetical protein
MLLHAIQNDPRVQGGALNGSEQFVLRGSLEIPTKSDAAQVGIDEDGAIAIVPSHAKQASLPRAIILKALAKSFYIASSARGDGLKNVADGR